jgi:hypothetical protein
VILRFKIKLASDEVKARGLTFITRERGDWVGVGTEANKEDRAVHFKGSEVECFSIESGDQCPANQFGTVCAHVWAGDRRRRINAKRRKTIERKRGQIAA